MNGQAEGALTHSTGTGTAKVQVGKTKNKRKITLRIPPKPPPPKKKKMPIITAFGKWVRGGMQWSWTGLDWFKHL